MLKTTDEYACDAQVTAEYVDNGAAGKIEAGKAVKFTIAPMGLSRKDLENYEVSYTLTNGTEDTKKTEPLSNGTVTVRVDEVKGDVDLTVTAISAKTMTYPHAVSAAAVIETTNTTVTVTYDKTVTGLRNTTKDIKTYVSTDRSGAVVTDVKVEDGKLVITFGTAALGAGNKVVIDNIVMCGEEQSVSSTITLAAGAGANHLTGTGAIGK